MEIVFPRELLANVPITSKLVQVFADIAQWFRSKNFVPIIDLKYMFQVID